MGMRAVKSSGLVAASTPLLLLCSIVALGLGLVALRQGSSLSLQSISSWNQGRPIGPKPQIPSPGTTGNSIDDDLDIEPSSACLYHYPAEHYQENDFASAPTPLPSVFGMHEPLSEQLRESTESDLDDAMGLEEPAINGKFFIYDSSEFNFTNVVECYSQRRNASIWTHEIRNTAQNTGELWMYTKLADHPNRTKDPEEADLFYVPLFSFTSFRTGDCQGTNHSERMLGVAKALNESEYWTRHNGADHLFICSFWECRQAMRPLINGLEIHRKSLTTLNELQYDWSNWTCPDRVIVTPYVANTAINRTLGNRLFECRKHSFFFSGCSRMRPERKTIVRAIGNWSDTFIDVHGNCNKFVTPASIYSSRLTNSKFCLNPRGDTFTSRRLFDSIAGGCIPIVEEGGINNNLPFSWKLDYTAFIIFTPPKTLSNETLLQEFCEDLVLQTKQDVQRFNRMQIELFRARKELMWGNVSVYDTEDGVGNTALNIINEAIFRLGNIQERNWSTECTCNWKQANCSHALWNKVVNSSSIYLEQPA